MAYCTSRPYLFMAWALDLGIERVSVYLCEGEGKVAPILPLFALFSGKSAFGLFLSPTEIFPGP